MTSFFEQQKLKTQPGHDVVAGQVKIFPGSTLQGSVCNMLDEKQ